MKKKYVVNYDCGSGEIIFEVDFDKFKKVAQGTLDFFLWSYDKDECPVTEAVKKYAEACMRFCMQEETTSIPYILDAFDQEGYCKLNGECGILLTSIYYPEVDETAFEVTINDIEEEKEGKANV